MSSKNLKTRARILEATWKLLEDNPANGVRMSDIAKQAKISRQAVYLHFPSRADLLVETTRYIDEVNDVMAQFNKTIVAKNGEEQLKIFIETWANYMLVVRGVAKALLAMKDTDEEAELAWSDRMAHLRLVGEGAVCTLEKDGKLNPDLSIKLATDLMMGMISFRNWEHLVEECSWSQKEYLKYMKIAVTRVLVVQP